MKVILLQDVKSLGKKGQTVNVSDGYATNFLIPRKLAVIATEKSLEIRNEEIKKQEEEDKKRREEALALKEKIEAIKLELKAKAGKDGKMFGSISSKQITDELKNKYDIVIDKRKISIDVPINTFGHTLVKVELYRGVTATIDVNVTEA